MVSSDELPRALGDLAPPSAEVLLSPRELAVRFGDGRQRWLPLDGAVYEVSDVACGGRCARLLVVEAALERLALVALAAHVERASPSRPLPTWPGDAVGIAEDAWRAVAAWVAGGGRLAGLSADELALLATVSTPTFAVAVGQEAAARVAEATALAGGPHRGGATPVDVLAPLRRAAASSPRATVALAAAVAATPPRRAVR